MSTRLTQIAIGGPTYDTPIDIDVGTASYGWTAYQADVDLDILQVTRLGQFGIGLAAYEEEFGQHIPAERANYGWSWYAAEVIGSQPSNVDAASANYGWSANPATVVWCGYNSAGYSGSFNAETFNLCSWNEHVFGPRQSLNIVAQRFDYGWQAFAADVAYLVPVDVDAARADYGWRDYPVSVSFAFDLQANAAAFGWTPQVADVSIPLDVAAQSADYGWSWYPAAVSLGATIGANLWTYGWSWNAPDVQVPSEDVNARTGQYGWQSLPAEVRQASLLPDDIALIVNTIWQKLVDEGLVQQVLESWQRQGNDPANPQTYRADRIQVGGIDIEIGGDSQHTIQTRQ